MILESIDWDEDLPADPEEEYQTFVRTLERTEGFRLFFVRCTPAEGERLIGRVKQDIPQKTVEILRLSKAIDTLYDQVENLTKQKQIDILFIQGLEYSFYEYEIEKFGEASERYFYSWKGVPRILNHLNQQRERFRDDFKICFVFILPQFGIKYFIRRSPDFFDWRSGVFEFPTDPEIVEKESSRILAEGDYQKYLTLTPQAQRQKIVEIQELLPENHQTPEDKAHLLFELGNLLHAAKEYKEAVASFDQALKIKPEDDLAWNNRGNALYNLGRYEQAVASFDQALKIKPDHDEAWNNRGIALDNLGRYEEAVASYDQALKIKPDYDLAWNNRGIALRDLGRYEEAVASYDQALKIKPDKDSAWYGKACSYALQGNVELAVENLQKAIHLSPDKYREMAKTDSDFDSIREDERFQTLIQGAIDWKST